MQKAARVSAYTYIPVPTLSSLSEKFGNHELVSVALFSGIGLLVPLVAILMGVQGAWY